MGTLQDRVIIVTGAAGGIGSALVDRFSADGAAVVAVDLASAIESAAADARLARAALAFAVDVSQELEVAAAIARVERELGPLACIVNNAAIGGIHASIEDYPLDEFEKVFAVDVRGVFLGTKHAAAAMKDRGGSIVNMASVNGLSGTPRFTAYVAAKHAVIGITKAAVWDVSRYNVRVNAVCPGPIATPAMLATRDSEGPDGLAHLARFAERTQMKRMGTPAEVAAVCSFLASDDSSYVTGATYLVDGGWEA